MSSEIRDLNLAESGELKIEWVKRNCDLLRMLEEEFSKTKPFAGKKIALSVHLEGCRLRGRPSACSWECFFCCL